MPPPRQPDGRSPLAVVRQFLAAEALRHLPPDDLWARFRDHADGDALRLFLERVGGRVAARCRAVLSDQALADDALQDALVQLVTHRRRLPDHARAVAWLYRVADSRARMLARGRRRLWWREWRAARPEQTTDPPPSDFAAVAAAVAGLPPRERRAVELVYLEGLTHDQAAAALGIGRGSVGKYVERGVKRLRIRFAPTALAAAAGLAPERAAALATAALAAPAGGVGLKAWVAAAVALVAVGGVGWGLRPGPAPPPVVAAETVPERSLRLFHADIYPRQLAEFGPQVLGGGPVTLEAVAAYDGRLECRYRFDHRHPDGRPFFATRLLLRHHSAAGVTQVVMDRFGDGKPVTVNPERFLIFWTDDPVTKKEITSPSNPLKRAIAAFDALPRDEAARAAWAAADARLAATLASLAGDWFADGDPAARWRLVREGGDLLITPPRGGDQRFARQWLRLDDAGRLHGLEPEYNSSVGLAADRSRITLPDGVPLTRSPE